MQETTQEREWIPGRNGGRLVKGGVGTPGAKRQTVLVRNGLQAALHDPKGGSGKDFWLRLKCGCAEDRRVFANIVSRLIPVEVSGSVAESLTVRVQHLVLSERDEFLPSHGRCAIGESEAIPTMLPTKTPSEAEESEQ